MVSRESKLREEFQCALKKNKCGNVVDDLIGILKRDYILLVKEPLYCRDCIHCNNTSGWISPAYCVYYQCKINNMSAADDCTHYFSGEQEARKSIARMHSDLTGDLFYE